ncbi:MAG: DNA polymerase III subunit delta' [Myxococcales bacterium]
MAFKDIVGQDRCVGSLAAALKSGLLHHGYLFGGPDGVGKELCARTLAQAANCEKDDGEACGQCGPCKRIAGRNHTDVVLVLPEAEMIARGWAGRADFDGTPSREIKIAQIRKLQERLAFKALEARRKFALILQADAMNVQAQNALLKTLEEPPDGTTLVLVSSAPHALLPTIRSRCLKLAFAPLPLEMVAQKVVEAKKVDLATARLCAALADGSIGAAMELDPKALARRKELLERLEALRSGDARGALWFAADFAEDRAAAEAHLDLICAWYRDVALLASGGEEASIANQDLAALARQSAGRLGAAEALRRIGLCNSARTTLRFNASPKLQLEQAALRFVYRDA